jgi:hypothetical protein
MREAVNITKTHRSCQVIFETFQYSSPPSPVNSVRPDFMPALHDRIPKITTRNLLDSPYTRMVDISRCFLSP